MIRPVQIKQEFSAQIYFAGTKAGKVGSVKLKDKFGMGSSSLKLGHIHVLSWGFLLGLYINQFVVLSIVLGEEEEGECGILVMRLRIRLRTLSFVLTAWKLLAPWCALGGGPSSRLLIETNITPTLVIIHRTCIDPLSLSLITNLNLSTNERKTHSLLEVWSG